MLRQIDRIAVGVEDAVFGFAVGRAFGDAGCRVEILARLADCRDIFDFEAEVVYSRLQLRPFSSSSGPANLRIVSAHPSVLPKQGTAEIASSASIQTLRRTSTFPEFRK